MPSKKQTHSGPQRQQCKCSANLGFLCYQMVFHIIGSNEGSEVITIALNLVLGLEEKSVKHRCFCQTSKFYNWITNLSVCLVRTGCTKHARTFQMASCKDIHVVDELDKNKRTTAMDVCFS